MSDVFVRPQTRFAAALLAAGVVSAGSLVGVQETHNLPTINVDVANASVITDWLGNFGNAVNAVANGVGLVPYTVFNLPFDATAAIAVAVQNPSLSPNVLSWLVQRYVNPSDAYGNNHYSYPWDFKVSLIEPLARLLPYPLGLNIINSVNQIANAIGDDLSGLPDWIPGENATNAFLNTDIGQTVHAFSLAADAPGWMLYDAASYLGYLPANVEASVESAIQDPSQIPGLVSNLVYGLGGLLGSELGRVTAPFTNLPGPIGELATNVVTAIYRGISGVLSMLPAPINPKPFPSAVQASVPSAATSIEANSLPAASVAVAGGITLKSPDPVEKKPDTTDSAVQNAQDPVGVSTAAAGDAKPVATPAAATDAAKTGADASVTNPVTSGNKVSPGDKFGNDPKGGTVKDTGAAASTPSGDKVAAGTTPVATGPQHGETEGAAASGASNPGADASSAGTSSAGGAAAGASHADPSHAAA